MESEIHMVQALEDIKVLTKSDVNDLIDTQINELLESKPWLGESLDNAIANYLETNEYITKEALNATPPTTRRWPNLLPR